MVKLYVPLQFFFCKSLGMSVPLIALQYHEVVLNLKIRNKNKIGNDVELNDIKLYGDYIFLDSRERKVIAQKDHLFIIEQLQYSGIRDSMKINHDLMFNHPVKELFWIFKKQNSEPMDFDIPLPIIDSDPKYNLIIDKPKNLPWFETACLRLNGVERFSYRNSDYFKYIQPYNHHTRIPFKNVYVYNFGLKPENQQPNGSCNFSRLDSAILQINPSVYCAYGDELHIFATNYNILKISSGMGGLMFSN